MFVGNQNIVDLLALAPEAASAMSGQLAGVAQVLPYNFDGWSKYLLSTPAEARAVCERVLAVVAKYRSALGGEESAHA